MQSNETKTNNVYMTSFPKSFIEEASATLDLGPPASDYILEY